jgi:hypothetical protein
MRRIFVKSARLLTAASIAIGGACHAQTKTASLSACSGAAYLPSVDYIDSVAEPGLPPERVRELACQDIVAAVDDLLRVRSAIVKLQQQETRLTAPLRRPLSWRTAHFRTTVYPRLTDEKSDVEWRITRKRYDEYTLCQNAGVLLTSRDHHALCGNEPDDNPIKNDKRWQALRELNPQ